MLNESFCRPMLAALRQSLFCPDTGMIYDYRTRCGSGAGFDHLPCTEEVRAGLPNPCGWGSGMEDCALNAGLALDICRMLPEYDTAWTGAIVQGVRDLATVHGQTGFIARGISRRAPGMTYANTSRDQLTVAVYGLWRTVRRRDLPDAVRREAATTIIDCANFCRTHINAANHWDLRRLDGGRAMVSKMWECDCHESLRLPMIYAAAAEVADGEPWNESAKQYFTVGLERTLRLDNRDSWWDLPTLQMQLSIRMLWESGRFDADREGLETALDAAGEYAKNALETTLCEAEAFTGDWHAWNENWRERPLRLYNDSIAPDRLSAAVDGKLYANPVFPVTYTQPNTLLRRLGSHLTILAMSIRHRPSESQMQRLENLLKRIDFTQLGGDGAWKLLLGLCWLNQGDIK